MSGINGKRGQNREDFILKVVVKTLLLRAVQFSVGNDPNFVASQFGHEFLVTAELCFQHWLYFRLNSLDTGGEGAFGGRSVFFQRAVAHSRHMNHKELVEVVTKDRQEFE